jgi:transposase
MSVRKPMLSDEQWTKIEPLIPKRPKNPKGGRPPADDRLAFEGILWILKTGARWKDMPEMYPHYSICWRRLKEWHETGVLKEMWRAFLSELDEKGVLSWEETFVDATFIPAKKGARRSGRPKGVKEQSAWWWSMARVFLWEAIPTLPRQLRSSSLRKSSRTSKYRKEDREDRGPGQSG